MKTVKVYFALALLGIAPAFAADSSRIEETLAAAGATAQTLDRNFSFAADGMLEVSNVRGSVVVTGGDRDGIHLGGSLGADSRLVLEGDARRLEMRVEANKGSGGFGKNGPGNPTDLVLEVPHGVSLRLDAVSADIKIANLDGKSVEIGDVSGNVRIEANARGIDIDSVSGDVILRVARPGATARAHLRTVSGNIEANGADGRVKLETVSGTVKFAAPSVGELGAESVSGNIEASFAPKKDARIHAETMSGDVRLHLPADLAARIHAETFSGNIRTDYGQAKKPAFGPGVTLDVDGGDSGARIDAQAFSGNVELRKGL